MTMAFWHKEERTGLRKSRPLYRKQDFLPALLVAIPATIALLILALGLFANHIVPHVLRFLSKF